MKFLKVFIICFSLFHLQIFQGKIVHAEDPTPTPQANTGTGVVQGAYQEAPLAAGTTVEENETKNPSLAAGHIFTAIQMIVIGLMAPNIITLCPGKASTYVYGAGALYYVAMELINMGKFVKGSNQEMAIYKNVEVDAQIEGLNAAAQETEEAADAAHKKADLSRNAAIVFAIAAAVALVEAFAGIATGYFSEAVCTGSWTYNHEEQNKKFNIFHEKEKVTFNNNNLTNYEWSLFTATQSNESNSDF